ncbi:MAG: DEAD/DEAH box helicase [Bryobacterales bacterium]|nr:DEAD/DEAH box helicase [Bryobacteraceae bacterium]MDW8129332.1 DEAD/DEAH box helicase [Bryobacterales bacterium]
MPTNLSFDFPELPGSETGLARRTGLDASLEHFRRLAARESSPVRAIHRQPARPGEYADFPEGLDPRLRRALAAQGIERLYSHQAEAFRLLAAGRNLVVVTPTASGKTLCYNLAVLNDLVADPALRAVYLFPTKALAEDQLHELQTLVDAIGADVRAFTYDGDTPQDARRAIRERANVVLTNPDMLHTGILPHHTRWAKFFEKLRYFVIDELHTYRGVYGSHLANLLRRLKRICAFYGSSPQFVCCSATIANPRELAERLLEEPVEVLDRNGAPSGEKYFIFYNPPVVNRQLGIRRSYLAEARRVAMEFLERGLQTLVFANNRLATEVLVTYLKDACARLPMPPGAVRGYRGGYLPRERRQIERGLRDGHIRCVAATNALELGIDIGSLDAVVMAGYPGTIASTWQRAGRAGRRQSASVAVLVASSAPLDQYIVEHPEYFFSQSPEHAWVNPDNLEILVNHLKCAAFELPLREGEKFGPHAVEPLCRFLEELRLLHHSGDAWHWTSDTYPADAISLRSITSDNFVVVDVTGEPEVIAQVDFPSALTALHEKAIYLHEARQYQVERFDYEGRKAYVRRVECDYFTDAIDYTQVKVLEELESAPLGQAHVVHGDVRVNRQIVGFKKVRFYTMENVGSGNLSMPEQEMHTTAFWLHFPRAFLERLSGLTPTEIQSGVAGLANVLRTVAAFLLMSDPRDLGVAVSEKAGAGIQTFEPLLFLYDAYPGGVGLSPHLFRMVPALLRHAADLLAGCQCDAGCPSCVGPVGEVGEGGKQAALRILSELMREAPAPPLGVPAV